MHRYECKSCGLTSKPFSTRRGAEERGREHRDARHDGMHPMHEAILSNSWGMPSMGDWKVFALVGALILAGLIGKATGLA